MRSFLFALAATLPLAAGGVAAVPADAMPAVVVGTDAAAPAVTLVSGGCGPYAHRDFRGFCRPGGGFYARPYGAYRRCFFRPTIFGPRRVCRFY